RLRRLSGRNYLTSANKSVLFASRKYRTSSKERDRMSATTGIPRVLASNGGLPLQSGPVRALVFKVTGEDTQGALDYFIVEVGPEGGPPLHVHHSQEETIHVVIGRFKVRIGDELPPLEPGGFAYLPAGLPHAFLNLTDEPAELIVVYAPGGCHKFY